MSKKSWIIIIAEALLFIFILGTMIRCNNDRISNLETNIVAYRDAIENVTLTNGELLASKQSLILSEQQAREELEISKSEIKELKKQLKSDLAYIAKLEAQVELKDTVWIKGDTVYVDGENTRKTFIYSDNWFFLNASIYGTSINDSKMSVDKLTMPVPLTIGLTDDYRFWVKTDNPYVTFTNIEGAVIDNSAVKKNKRFHHGIYVGFGFQYGLFGKQFDFGPQAGYCIMYSF